MKELKQENPPDPIDDGVAADKGELLIDLAAEPSPRQIVEELDRYIIGQKKAKKAVAIALRNRWRRQNVGEEMREEILPNNIIMIGPTGVGKTEIARRLARLAGAPFIKVEASKFTEVGYVGRDVDSIIRELVELSVSMVRGEREEDVEEKAAEATEERILDLLLPPLPERKRMPRIAQTDSSSESAIFEARVEKVEEASLGSESTDGQEAVTRRERIRDKLRQKLRAGEIEDRKVEIEFSGRGMPFVEFLNAPGMEEMDFNLSEMLEEMIPRKKKKREVTVAEARRMLIGEEIQKMVDMEDVINDAIERVEDSGIVFLDEIDKITGPQSKTGPDISREGVQRDLLPIVEGSNVPTKYGLVRTDHILFIAAGAFHQNKPSDLIPELQGRFPIRVELDRLDEQDFYRILTEPKNALVRQYEELVRTEGAEAIFEDEAVRELARMAFQLNQKLENIGARRLHTVMFSLMEDVLFELPESGRKKLQVTKEFVHDKLEKLVEDEDLRKYIL
ncbi:MAG TPA: ATP-dependent protease ATPase subunit HslU [Candidatus Glassbacteria bacterium]|nr:ATP-dependent protease ATPase subunit HslU [Candidatus Glassbacteria bacterium]